MTLLDNLSEGAKHTVDAVSATAIVGSLFSVLPQISALLAAIWFALRIYESLQRIRLNARELRKP